MSEYLSEEEQLAALRSFWQRYGLWLVGGLVVVMAAYLGWSYYQSSKLERAQQASELYEEYLESNPQNAGQNAGQNEPDEALSNSLAARLDDEFPGTSYQIFSLFTRATAAIEDGELDAAAEFLERATAGDAPQQLKDVGLLRLARLRQQTGNSEAALAALGATRGEGYRSVVAELKGDIHMARDEIDLAREAYSAALETAAEAEPRPLLTMKLAQIQEPN